MATEPEKTKTDPPAKVTAGDLRDWIKTEIATVVDTLGGGKTKTDDKPTEKVERTGSVADEVKAEIAKLRAKEKADQRERTIDEQLAALTAKTLPKPPIERKRPRIHRFMGWGDNE